MKGARRKAADSGRKRADEASQSVTATKAAALTRLLNIDQASSHLAPEVGLPKSFLYSNVLSYRALAFSTFLFQLVRSGRAADHPPVPTGPVGRAAQAAVCKTVQKGATPLRDSIFKLLIHAHLR